MSFVHFAEVAAEAVLERLALGLAVIRDHHDVVAPGSVRRQSLERSQDPIQAVQSRQRLGTEHAGMVSDLVVVDVVDVDALRPLPHLLRDDRGVEIALQHVGGGSKYGKGPSAMDAWQDVEACLSGGLPPLFQISASVLTSPRVKPLGLVRNQANVCRVAADPRPPPSVLMVSMARGASPVKRLPRASPSSASNPARLSRAAR